MKTKEVEVINEIMSIDETLEQKIIRIKAEQTAELNSLLEQQKAVKAKIKALKFEDVISRKLEKQAKSLEKSEKIKLLLLNNEVVVKENKSQKVRELLLQGKSKEEMKELLGYDNKFLLDTIWRIEKSLGL